MGRERRLPPLPWLIAFEAAARHKSFGTAARVLGTSQPAISQRIANLEAMLSMQLFVRVPRGVHLTPGGSTLLAGLGVGLDIVESAIENASHRNRKYFTIATDHGFAAFWLIPRLPFLQQAIPEISFRVITSQEKFDVGRDTADVAIVFGSGHWPGAVAQLLIRETVLPVCSPGFLAERAVASSVEDLLRMPLLHLESNVETQWLDWEGWFDRFDVEHTISEQKTTFNNHGLVIQAALAGHGVALGWRPLTDKLLECGQLVTAIDEAVVTDRGYYLVYKTGRNHEHLLSDFCRWLHGELNIKAP